MSYKNISNTLKLGAIALLGSGCNSTDGDNSVSAELPGTWSKCVQTFTSASQVTSRKIIYKFYTNGTYFSQGIDYNGDTCSTPLNSSIPIEVNGTYIIGDLTKAIDGSDAYKIDMHIESPFTSSTYTIYQIDSSVHLFLGSRMMSSSGKDGESDITRYDGLTSDYYIKIE